MINQVAEAIYSATYVENYLDYVENLPNDVQRHLSRIREIDVEYRGHLRDMDNFYDQWSNCSTNELESANATRRTRAMARIQKSLIAAQELGDEKLQIVNQLQELIDQKSRQLDLDFKNLDYGKDEPMAESSAKDTMPTSPSLPSPSHINSNNCSAVSNVAPPSVQSSISHSASSERFQAATSSSNTNNCDRSNKRARRARADNGNSVAENAAETLIVEQGQKTAHIPNGQNTASSTQKKAAATGGGGGGGKKKKRKSARGQATNAQGNNRDDLTPPPEETIDPDEPTYCLCDQISFGEMILCDNDLCPIEWFHFSCVSLLTKPKGKWYCPNCRGDRPNCMKPKAQFLKELERYNKEKEEKT
ncbi:Inhibitor of growth protein 2 [Pseudolycoriella hygida]|uniref:Inhibitor of growth protein n=1 Tax=Pseudolycoriella hygida TaxID=35572 RepID=A0A9Q0MKV1_9DIPT|nr:Inhibitor of growth protein 2 [Pseudolycoriella hygida]